MTLDKVKRKTEVEIVSIPMGDERSQLMRMGIIEGVRVTCSNELILGAVIVKSRRQELAIGKALARCIEVKKTEGC